MSTLQFPLIGNIDIKNLSISIFIYTNCYDHHLGYKPWTIKHFEIHAIHIQVWVILFKWWSTKISNQLIKFMTEVTYCGMWKINIKFWNDWLRLFKNLCQSGKITNTQGHTDEYRNRCRAVCSWYKSW